MKNTPKRVRRNDVPPKKVSGTASGLNGQKGITIKWAKKNMNRIKTMAKETGITKPNSSVTSTRGTK